jgi:hypothetical protein
MSLVAAIDFDAMEAPVKYPIFENTAIREHRYSRTPRDE